MLPAVAALLLLVACQTPPPELTQAEVAQIEADVMEVALSMHEGFRALDAEAVATVFHPTESGFDWNGQIYNGTDIVAPLARNFENRVADEREWVDMRVKVISRNVALFLGSAQATMQQTSGEIIRYPGNLYFSLLFERTNEGWKSTFGAIRSGPAERLGEG